MSVGTHIKNFALYVDGVSYVGEAEEVNLPKLTKVMEEFRAGGMDAPIEVDMGMEKLEADFQLAGTKKEILELFGTADQGGVSLTLRKAVSDETGVIVPHVATLNGTIKSIEHSTIKTKDRGNMKVMLCVTYYKYEIGNEVSVEIDTLNMVCAAQVLMILFRLFVMRLVLHKRNFEYGKRI